MSKMIDRFTNKSEHDSTFSCEACNFTLTKLDHTESETRVKTKNFVKKKVFFTSAKILKELHFLLQAFLKTF